MRNSRLIVIIWGVLFTLLILGAVSMNLMFGQSRRDPCDGFYQKAVQEVQKFERNESSFATMYATMYLACRENGK